MKDSAKFLPNAFSWFLIGHPQFRPATGIHHSGKKSQAYTFYTSRRILQEETNKDAWFQVLVAAARKNLGSMLKWISLFRGGIEAQTR